MMRTSKIISAAALACAFAGPAAAANSYAVLHSFDRTDGSGPGPLIDVHGRLYGGAAAGGANGMGTVFSTNPANGKTAVLYSFGTTASDGAMPEGALLDVGGTLYGTTVNGGAYGAGTVFSIDPATATETVLHSFGNGGDGANPYAALIDVKGTLYGTTGLGGSAGVGTVFAIDTSTGAESVLYSFQNNGEDGYLPLAALLESGGVLYGTTNGGGGNTCSVPMEETCGTVFTVDPGTGRETVLHSFDGTDGSSPGAGLINVSGKLYGTTEYGGAYEGGTIFRIGESGAEAVLQSFCRGTHCALGYRPLSALTDVDGTFYGVTWNDFVEVYGGGAGRLFSFDQTTGKGAVLHTFKNNGRDGFLPHSNVLYVDGTLYGTTSAGGTSSNCNEGTYTGCGTVYKLTP